MEIETFEELFDVEFVYALQFGMSYEDFWHGDAEMFWAYQTAFQNKIALDFEVANYVAWLQGLYVHRAVASVIHNAFAGEKETPLEYFEKPIDFENFAEEEKEKKKLQLETKVKSLVANKQAIINRK